MNAEIKTKWLEALRNGKYQQCTGVLQNNGSFCCVGVLCDVIDPTSWQKINDYRFEHNGAAYMPREGFFREIGLEQDVVDNAVAQNDIGKDFLTIARYLEEHA